MVDGINEESFDEITFKTGVRKVDYFITEN